MLIAKDPFRSVGKHRPGLDFGIAAQVEAVTAESNEQYKALRDRENCVVCGWPLEKYKGLPDYKYPCCSWQCAIKYREWLNR